MTDSYQHGGRGGEGIRPKRRLIKVMACAGFTSPAITRTAFGECIPRIVKFPEYGDRGLVKGKARPKCIMGVRGSNEVCVKRGLHSPDRSLLGRGMAKGAVLLPSAL
ncbi:MAG: hypothetical protein DRH56_00785 [Deltaproteobacteria bacterium]|nr:MAG: hypothetical protein DRH56_00785 [Deltaproteobacteria bacterium]